jgi:hypothetical protein
MCSFALARKWVGPNGEPFILGCDVGPSWSYICEYPKAALKMNSKLDCEVDAEGTVDMLIVVMSDR